MNLMVLARFMIVPFHAKQKNYERWAAYNTPNNDAPFMIEIDYSGRSNTFGGEKMNPS
jgi:hypothetical protein